MGSVLDKTVSTGSINKTVDDLHYTIIPNSEKHEHFSNSDKPNNVTSLVEEYREFEYFAAYLSDVISKSDKNSHSFKIRQLPRLVVLPLSKTDNGKIFIRREKIKHEIQFIPNIGKLKKPLQIYIDFEDDLYFVECPHLEIYDHGESKSQAMANFFETVQFMLNEFKTTPEIEKHESFILSELKYREYLDF